MEAQKDIFGMLDLMIRPAFCVMDNRISRVNAAAEGLLIAPGTDVCSLLDTGKEEYRDFFSGCLYLTLNLSGKRCGACVSPMGDSTIFILDPETEDAHLQAFALAAMELRQPLLNTMLSADRLARECDAPEALARLNRGLHQLHRILNNMSDASLFSGRSHQEVRDLDRDFREIFEKARHLVAHTGLSLTYRGPNRELLSLADREQLERAVLNILSNAIKFTPEGGRIDACLSCHGPLLRLSITDTGSGIGENLLHSTFHRYLRQPAIEDNRFGIGLGMVLIRAAAANHGGTVLIDQPAGMGTRVTMTLRLRQGSGTALHTPIDLPGGQDMGLIELSECLPPSLYEK